MFIQNSNARRCDTYRLKNYANEKNVATYWQQKISKPE